MGSRPSDLGVKIMRSRVIVTTQAPSYRVLGIVRHELLAVPGRSTIDNGRYRDTQGGYS